MKKFIITNSDNTKMTVDLVRYFSFKNDNFLIYSIGEIDEKGYLKLYLVRIMEELGFPVVQTIRNEADWSNMQGIVKKVLKELKRNNKKQMVDLNYKDIEGIKISQPRFFKLDPKLVEILASNYMEDESNVQISGDNTIPNENQEPNMDILEPIEVTMENQGDFVPVNVDDRNDLSSELKPVEPLPQIEDGNSFEPTSPIYPTNVDIIGSSEIISPVKPLPQVENVVSLEPFKKGDQEETPMSSDQPLYEIQKDSEPILNPIVDQTNVGAKKEVDYEQLYLTVSKDNEAANKLIDELTIKLLKYKEKYGELDD